ncbi:Rho GDP-dissociation inhibitor protein [Dioscorea alata]|uniref:Rho GDP-dissociation inhibitor protein n=1 Tax=Dioscorea alata TaxID=55571 RepID=A0ACB7WMX0_DIOAL|nr:Rho GDP-dissociation inhibitor protein [Dioscorea alata]
MSLAVGALSNCSQDMGFDENKDKNGVLARKEVDEKRCEAKCEQEKEQDKLNLSLNLNLNIPRKLSEASLYATEDEEEEEEEDDEEKGIEGLDLGPQLSLKDQFEKDKDDESLRRWKEQLLGSVDLTSVGENLEPEVKIMSLSIQSPGRPDIVLPIPVIPNSKGLWFTLKEGSQYKLKFTFSVNNNIVSGLKYINAVWKTGVKVDSTKEMLGTFSPQVEPYICEVPEDTTPSGIFARGSYSAKTKFVDDDGKCYLELNYTFDIRKEWSSIMD